MSNFITKKKHLATAKTNEFRNNFDINHLSCILQDRISKSLIIGYAAFRHKDLQNFQAVSIFTYTQIDTENLVQLNITTKEFKKLKDGQNFKKHLFISTASPIILTRENLIWTITYANWYKRCPGEY